MIASAVFVFDASPLVAGCQFSIDGISVAARVLAGVHAQIPPAVYDEVITRGGTRPDAREAARLVQAGTLRVADATQVAERLDDLQYYQVGQGEQEAITLTARLQGAVALVTDDFLALIVAHRLGLSAMLFLDFIINRARRGDLEITEAQQTIDAISARYPRGFVPHSLALLKRLQS